MEETIISDWNKAVQKNDVVNILGDVIWSPHKEDWLRIMKSLNGCKTLIRGNHDIKQFPSELKSCLADIKDRKEVTDNGRHVIMDHYPILCYKASYNPDVWMLHGHTHTTREQDFVEKWTRELIKSKTTNSDNCGHIMNVGCMMPYMNFVPQTLDTIIEAWKCKYNIE